LRYISVDIETTGLEPEIHQIIEFAAVLDDLEELRDVNNLPRFHAYVRPRDGIYRVSEYCLGLHVNIWKKLSGHLALEPGEQIVYDDELPGLFWRWLSKVNWPLKAKMQRATFEAVTVSGKNFASFDEKFIVRLPQWKEHEIRFHHRKLDPAVYFARPTDKVVPDTNECLQRAGIEATTDHRAVGDALNVIRLLRAGMFPTKT